MEKAANKIAYLDGIRGVAAFMVFLHHFFLAFYIGFYIPDSGQSHLHGWEVKYGQSVFSVFSNGHFAVCVFFVLSGYVLSRKYVQANELNLLVSGAQRRFLRLYIPIAAVMILAFILMVTNCYHSQALSRVTHSEIWIGEDPEPPHVFMRLLQCLLYKTMFLGDNVFDTSLWTISTEFYGSMFVFAFLGLTHKTRNRLTMLFLALVVAFFMKTILAAFIFGISLNYIEKVKFESNKFLSNGFAALLLLVSLLLGSFPTTTEIRGTIFENMPQWLYAYNFWFHTIGAILLVLAFVVSSWLQYFISLRLFRFMGYISFSFYLLHPVIIFTFSSALFLSVFGYLGYNAGVAVVFLCTLALCLLLSYFMTKYVDEPGNRFAKYVYERWVKKAPVPEMIRRA
jgi:peptidoglycan/LPS O-acetylase OafA/YrhL